MEFDLKRYFVMWVEILGNILENKGECLELKIRYNSKMKFINGKIKTKMINYWEEEVMK